MLDFSKIEPDKMTDMLLLLSDFSEDQNPEKILEFSFNKYKASNDVGEKLNYLEMMLLATKSLKKELKNK
ncbi:MAG TPA: hypothetical protein VF691_03410 [Cytophagaceae bacterium]|jgi:hypothetical protein